MFVLILIFYKQNFTERLRTKYISQKT